MFTHENIFRERSWHKNVRVNVCQGAANVRRRSEMLANVLQATANVYRRSQLVVNIRQDASNVQLRFLANVRGRSRKRVRSWTLIKWNM